jgi:hypothetical protein
MLALLPALEGDAVRQFAVEQRLELRAIDRSGEAKELCSPSVPLGGFAGAVLHVVVVLGVIGAGLRGGSKDAD